MTDTHIKINAVTPRVQYTGNGSTTVFPYEFPIFDESDMVVYFGDEVQESGYSVSGAGQTEGGNVTFAVAPEDGIKITLLRNVPIERITDFQEGGTFRPKNLNDEFDRQTAFLQQVQETLDRSVKVGPTSDITPEVVLAQVERVYDSIDNVDAVADDISNVNAVAGNSTNINAVAGDQANIDAVASNLANIDAVTSNSTNINAVASDATNIDTVATNVSDVNTVAGSIANVNIVAGSDTNIGTVATNISDVNDCADNMAAIVDAPNQAQAAADSAALAQQYANDKINQTHITNCITEIPQDIKLELNNGTLTLKAGSKVYVPNGVDTFDELVIENNLTLGELGSYTGSSLLYVLSDGSSLVQSIDSTSGTTAPSGTAMWLDTTANKIKQYVSGSWDNNVYSFPIAQAHRTNGTWDKIDKVFNGLGYIGSIIFALPGVKGLIPDGRNDDGSLKNIAITLTEVATYTSPYANITDYQLCISNSLNITVPGNNTYSYDEENNYSYIDGNLRLICNCGSFATDSNNKIYNFVPKTAFRALDWNDKRTIAGWSMPSSQYQTVTLLASNNTYTAPANGYFHLNFSTLTGGFHYIHLVGHVGQTFFSTSDSLTGLHISIPAEKGESVLVSYGSISASNFRFYYAEGEV